MNRRRRFWLVVGLALVYATCYSAIKAGLTYAPPLRFAGLRAVLGGVFLLGFIAIRRRPVLPPRRLWGGIVILAASGTSLGFGAMFLAPGYSGAGIASVLGNTGPLMVMVLAATFLGERITAAKTGALVLGLIGATLIAYPAITDPSRRGWPGAMLPLLAAAGTAIQSVIVKRLDLGQAVLPATAWQFVLGGLPLLLVSVAVERGIALRSTGIFLALFLFLTVVGTSAATALWFRLVQDEEVGRLTLQLFLVPVFGLLLAIALFGERIGGYEVAGIVSVLSAIGLTIRASRHRAPLGGERATLP